MGKLSTMFSFTGSERRSCLGIRSDVEDRVGRIPFSTRYHQEPHQLEDDYVMLSDVLGSGLNGKVTSATSKTNPKQRFAVKVLRVNQNTKEMNYIKAEVQNYLCLDHPHIASLFAVYETEQHIRLVMECLEGGDLYDRLIWKSRLSEDEARDVTRQLLLALNYMHSHGMVHRDIKLDNCMFATKGGNHLKLIDFGFSTLWSPQSSENMQKCLGTLSYCAPEVLDKNYTSQCDLWSLGVVTWVLLSGRMLFHGNQADQIRNIRAGKCDMKPEVWDGISSEAKDFVRSLLNVCPAYRMSAQQALRHPWIAGGHVSHQSSLVQVAHSLQEFSHLSAFRRSCMRVLALSLPHGDQAKLCDLFLASNTSNTGAITLTELRSIMAEKNITDDREVQRILTALDYNRDQKIHYSDFLAAMTSNMNIEGDSVRFAFRAFDKDSSGSITACNLREVLGKMRVRTYINEADQQNQGHISYADFEKYMNNEESKFCDNENETTSIVPKSKEKKRVKVQKLFAKSLYYIRFVGGWPA